MAIEKENKLMLYRGEKGRFHAFMNVEGKQFRTTLYPNVSDDMTVKSWGGNIYDATEELNNNTE